MSQDPEEGAEKSHEPTPKKLEDARRRGEIPKSTDLTTAAVYLGVLLVLTALGGRTLTDFGGTLSTLLADADTLSAEWFEAGGRPFSAALVAALAAPVLIWLGLPAGLALASLIGQRAIVFAPEKLALKLNRLSLLQNAKNKFGRGGLFEFAKSAVKLVIYSAVLGIFLHRQLPEIIVTAQLNPAAALSALGRMTIAFLSIVLAVAVVLGLVDIVWQHEEHRRKNMMSRKELTDEAKQSEGDPHIKQQRRQRAQEIAMNSMLSDVPKADVVVVNPTHYAVALRWTRMPGSAPICVAKGVDQIAARIRECAIEAAVPIHRDPPSARALFATVEIGQEIRPEHYEAVAAAIRFAEAMRLKARQPGQ